MANPKADDEDDDVGYESGPFCRHWSDPSYCDEKCKRCGHPCRRHYGDGDNDACGEDGCTCEGWVEDEETTEPSKG